MPTPWHALQQIHGLVAVSSQWWACVGDDFPRFRTFLQTQSIAARSMPCSQCTCYHEIISFDDGSMVGVCRCDPRLCDDVDLKPEDIALWQLNWRKFARAISAALGLASKFEEFGPNTFQIGTWSAEPVSVFLTIQWDEREFRLAVASLVAQQKSRFILLAPTSAHMDATSQSYLANADAEFFSLESHLILTERGTFQPTKAPGEIFARFTPQPKDPVPEDVARTAYSVLEKLDADRPPTPFTVWRLYGKQEMSAQQVARQCHCSKATVVRRLKFIRAKTGLKPQDLRTLSPHFNKIEDDITDSRAKSVYRKGVVNGDSQTEE